jgi:hypothetical protein
MMNELIGKYSIDGKDFYTNYKIAIKRAPDELLRLPRRKDSITHDWGDSDGKEVDLSKPFFESRDFTLECIFIVNTKAEFWDNRDAFMAEWRKPGTRRFYVDSFQRSFFVYYKDCSKFERFTKMRDGKIVCELNLLLNEPQPQGSGGGSISNRLVDQTGNYLIA